MLIKSLTAATFAVALAAVPAQEARADAGDIVGGLIVGGLIGAAIANGNNGGGNRGTTSGGGGIPASQMGRDTQTALNYFGFNAGAVDGQIGNGTRQAIERYQLVMGFPVNGREYATYQYDQLMQAYYWGLNGGSAQTGLVGQPLLMAYRDAQLAPQQPQVVVVPAPAPVQPVPQVVAQPPVQTIIVPAPQPAASNK
ncbi:peptidoglycan-binding domain-containing protein [Nioella aestuarii]|uniref:peptidoglycan-binding domain-containing protein n=1 Tax=Nioella aestuarii TaxID=1662864 RepID=UPI003D7FEA60